MRPRFVKSNQMRMKAKSSLTGTARAGLVSMLTASSTEREKRIQQNFSLNESYIENDHVVVLIITTVVWQILSKEMKITAQNPEAVKTGMRNISGWSVNSRIWTVILWKENLLQTNLPGANPEGIIQPKGWESHGLALVELAGRNPVSILRKMYEKPKEICSLKRNLKAALIARLSESNSRIDKSESEKILRKMEGKVHPRVKPEQNIR